jgi:hypothetical protein
MFVGTGLQEQCPESLSVEMLRRNTTYASAVRLKMGGISKRER